MYGHQNDVRDVCAYSTAQNQDIILSSSRDKTAKVWRQTESSNYENLDTLRGHQNFVSCICAVYPATEIYPDGLICTGSNDKSINIYKPGESQPLETLKGHSENVSCMASGNDLVLVSGSWDKTARLWNLNDFTGGARHVMKGHQAAVWAVLYRSSDGMVVTASADKNIRIFINGSLTITLNGHSDCVRGLAWFGNDSFLSCSNDTTIRRWSTVGICNKVYYGHTNYVYSIAALPNYTGFVTCSEDRTVRVWEESKENSTQSLLVPATSPWSVACLSNGDVAVGCSDATLRMFTKNPENFASEEVMAAYENELKESKIPAKSSGLGNIDPSKLPTVDQLESRPGQKDGETKMAVDENKKIFAYSWSNSEYKWTCLGEVTGSKEDKKMYKGKEYDYVIDVDIAEGRPPLKLPYNVGDDAYLSAQKFIDDNELPQDFLDQIASFIMKNTKQEQEQPADITMVDPFTGAGGYRAGSGGNGPTGGVDPFTGASSYTSGGAGQTAPSGGQDPFTGAGRHVPENESSQTNNPYFPQTGLKFFENVNLSSMAKKIEEFSEQSQQKLSKEELSSVMKLVESKQTVIDENQFQGLWNMLHWPSNLLFPVLDLLRYFVFLQKDAATDKLLSEDRKEETFAILKRCICEGDGSKASLLSVTCASRCLCNFFCTERGGQFVAGKAGELFEGFRGLPDNKNARVALATLAMNVAAFVNGNASMQESPARLACVNVLLTTFLPHHSNEDACLRSLVALGTVLHGNDICKVTAASLEAKQILSDVAGKFKHKNENQSAKVVECVQLINKSLI